MGKYFKISQKTSPSNIPEPPATKSDIVLDLVERIDLFMIKNQFLFPFAMLFLFFGILLIKGAEPLDVLSPALIFVAGYLILHFILKLSPIVSSIFAFPTFLVFFSIVFRIGLWLGSSVSFFALIFSFLILALCVFLLKQYSEFLSLDSLFSFEQVGLIGFLVLFWGSLSLLVYDFYLGHISPDKIFWGSNDSNWQISTLSHISKTGIFEIPSYLCQGITGFDLDSQTSTLSLVVFYLSTFFSTSVSGGHFVSLNLFFAFMLIGILILFSRIFGSRYSIFIPVFALFPFCFQLLLVDILGMWRVSLFDFLLPFALFFSIFLIQNLFSYLLLFLFGIFLFLIQPFESLLLIPSVLLALYSSRNQLNLKPLLLVLLLSILFSYFFFFQITFKTIGSAVSLEKGLHFPLFGMSAIQVVESFESLVSRLQVSMVNLGPISLFICALSIFYGLYNLIFFFKNPQNYPQNSLYLSLIFGLIICSGILIVSPGTIQYILKTRYPYFLVLVFPFFTLLISKIIGNPLDLKFFAVIGLLSIFSFSYLLSFLTIPDHDQFLRDDLYSFIKSKNYSNLTLLAPESFLGQSASYHLGLRSLYISDSDLSNINYNNFSFAEHTFSCSFMRFGPFDVREKPLTTKFSTPDIALIIRPELDPRYSSLFFYLNSNGYSKVFNTTYYEVYSKVG